MKSFFTFVFLACILYSADAQNKAFDSFRVMSYNVENLFDTEDNPLVMDDEFLPNGSRYWTKGRYYRKLQSLSKVILAAGEWNSLALIGLCEVENDSVIHHLLRRTSLWNLDYNYCITHGCDQRGINVALLYQRNQFKLIGSEEIKIPLGEKERSTRNILHVWGQIKNLNLVDVFVCHFPSRYGGELASRKKRIVAARTLRRCVDSLFIKRKAPKIIIMGDFNDTPVDESLSLYLNAKPFPADSIQKNELYNLFYESSGSHKYQGEWNQLDHIVVNGSLLQVGGEMILEEGSNRLFNPSFLRAKDKTWRGERPFRTYYGYKYEGGFSDHYPLLSTFLLNEKRETIYK